MYKLDVGGKINDMIIRQGQDVSFFRLAKLGLLSLPLMLTISQLIKVVADEKGLNNTKRESATMYVEDLAEFA